MYPERVKQFKIRNTWTELANKQIRQIDAVLREVQCLPQNGNTIVRGVIHRAIRYLEKEGLLRKTEDWIQFEINLEEPVPILPSPLNIELRPDFFLWQPGSMKEKKATLEQGFSLIFRNNPHLAIYEAKSILVKSIVAKGDGVSLIQIPVTLPLAGVQPKKCDNINIRFYPTQQPPVIDAEILGEIKYRTGDGLVKEVDLQQPISLLLDLPTPAPNQTLAVQGEIGEVIWKKRPSDESWTAEGKLNYQWFISEPQTVICKTALKEEPEKVHKLKTAILLADERFEIAKTFGYFGGNPISDINFNAADLKYDLQVRKKTLLLNAHGFWDITFVDDVGIERYRQLRFDLDELIPYQGLPDIENTLFTTDLQVKLTDYSMVGNELTIIACCFFHFQAYNHRLVNIMVEEGDVKKLVFAKRFIGNQVFNFHGEAVFYLQSQPLHMETPRAKVGTLKPILQNGWFRVEGWVEIAVAYIDHDHLFREDLLKANFDDSFIWEPVEPTLEFEISANLEYDSFQLEDHQLNYKYFIKMVAEIYREEPMEVALAQAQIPETSDPIPIIPQPAREPSPVAKFEIEAELPLTHGRMKELIESRTLITQFEYRDSGAAVLIIGELTGEVEYWDEDYYLRKEPVKVSFWRFIPSFSDLPLKRCKLIPEVNHIRYSPLKTWPWQRMMLQIHFEFGIRCEVDGSENIEGVISKPEQFPELSGRG